MPPIALWERIPLRDGRPKARRSSPARPGGCACRVSHELETGDHTFFVAAVEAAEPGPAGTRPLVLHDQSYAAPVIEAVVFDLDGVLLDSEQVWDEAREQLAKERGGRWHDQAQKDMMGMSSTEWSRYMHERIGLPEPPEEINREVVERLAATLPRAPSRDARRQGGRRAARRPLAARARVLVEPRADRPGARAAGREHLLRRRRSPPRRSPAASPRRTSTSRPRAGSKSTRPDAAAVEDSNNGILAAKAAGMRVLAIPNRHFPPGEDALAQADVVLDSLAELTAEAVEPR